MTGPRSNGLSVSNLGRLGLGKLMPKPVGAQLLKPQSSPMRDSMASILKKKAMQKPKYGAIR